MYKLTFVLLVVMVVSMGVGTNDLTGTTYLPKLKESTHSNHLPPYSGALVSYCCKEGKFHYIKVDDRIMAVDQALVSKWGFGPDTEEAHKKEIIILQPAMSSRSPDLYNTIRFYEDNTHSLHKHLFHPLTAL